MSIRINGVDRTSTIKDPKAKADGQAVRPSQIDVDQTSLGTYHMMANPKLYEPQRSNHFEFIISGEGFSSGQLERAGMFGNESAETRILQQPQEMIRMSVVSAPIPHFSQDEIPVKRGNTTVYYAGNITWDAGELSVNDFIGADTKSILYAWQAMSGDPYTEKVGHASDYKKDCYLVEYTPDFQKVRQWILYGCWVKSLREDSYNAENNTKKVINATIRYDRGVLDTSDLV